MSYIFCGTYIYEHLSVVSVHSFTRQRTFRLGRLVSILCDEHRCWITLGSQAFQEKFRFIFRPIVTQHFWHHYCHRFTQQSCWTQPIIISEIFQLIFTSLTWQIKRGRESGCAPAIALVCIPGVGQTTKITITCVCVCVCLPVCGQCNRFDSIRFGSILYISFTEQYHSKKEHELTLLNAHITKNILRQSFIGFPNKVFVTHSSETQTNSAWK